MGGWWFSGKSNKFRFFGFVSSPKKKIGYIKYRLFPVAREQALKYESPGPLQFNNTSIAVSRYSGGVKPTESKWLFSLPNLKYMFHELKNTKLSPVACCLLPDCILNAHPSVLCLAHHVLTA